MSEQESRIDELREQFAQSPFSRAHDRLPFEVPVAVEILIPEDTFRPQKFKGYTLNISAKGMQVALELVQSQLYSKMLSRQRMARVSLAHPESGAEIGIMGHIAWIDFRRSGSDQPTGDCCLGITFSEKVDGVDLTDYMALVEDAKRMLRDGLDSGNPLD